MSDELDLVEIYGFYRHSLNEILARKEATAEDAILKSLEDAESALKEAFLEEVFPTEMEESYRHPAIGSVRQGVKK